jgi:hypothetical protein
VAEAAAANATPIAIAVSNILNLLKNASSSRYSQPSYVGQ